MKPILKDITLVGLVVKDLYRTLDSYTHTYGIGPWNIYENENETVAVSKIGNTVWEIVSLASSASIYDKLLKNAEEGLAYLGYRTENLNSALDYFKGLGLEIIYSQDDYFLVNLEDLKHTAKIYIPTSRKFNRVYPLDSSSIHKHLLARVRQIGFVITDIKKTAANYADKYNVGGPWKFFKYYSPKIKDMQYHSRAVFDQKFTTSAVIPNIANIEVELMEPQGGPSIYKDHLDSYGEGLQHISFIYNPSFKKVMDFHKERGDKILQQGNINELIYVYIDTVSELKFISELLYVPENFDMPPSDGQYPNQN